MIKSPLTINGRVFQWPKRTLVAICLDGSEPAYTDEARKRGLMPNLEKLIAKGGEYRANSVVPSFTNPNNLSIATGRPPEVHGICGNYLIDPDTGLETMMNDPKWLRAPTIFAEFQKAGARILMVTAKDKLRLLLSKGLVYDGTAIAFSSEKANIATLKDNGIDNPCAAWGMALPDVYSGDLSEFVFAAGVKLIPQMKPDLVYLSTTDFIQHKFGPTEKGALDFYAMFDRYVGELDALGVTLIITADHGMNDKHTADGKPDVLYLQDALDQQFGAGKSKVILPITDPYVVHHGALGSFATVYLAAGAKHDALRQALEGLRGMDRVLAREDAAAEFELPADRIGDLVCLAARFTVIGTSASRHDLSGLDAPLRSHGGASEQAVPLIINRPIPGLDPHRRWRNFDAFDLALNHAQ
ncbi:MAG: phosphonoacetate hydrolase [Alphaproteobacteria bacterium]|nr:phosphonoacetate hydrolase [Alphaproteobacteria bacterium]